jgi:hypothetical protein
MPIYIDTKNKNNNNLLCDLQFSENTLSGCANSIN